MQISNVWVNPIIGLVDLHPLLSMQNTRLLYKSVRIIFYTVQLKGFGSIILPG